MVSQVWLRVLRGLAEPGAPNSLNSSSEGSMIVAQPVATHSAINSARVFATRDVTEDHVDPGSSYSQMALRMSVYACAAAASAFLTTVKPCAWIPVVTLPT